MSKEEKVLIFIVGLLMLIVRGSILFNVIVIVVLALVIVYRKGKKALDKEARAVQAKKDYEARVEFVRKQKLDRITMKKVEAKLQEDKRLKEIDREKRRAEQRAEDEKASKRIEARKKEIQMEMDIENWIDNQIDLRRGK